MARKICEELGIELIEANAENATAAGEAGASVLSRRIDALWISPDVTVVTAIDVLLAAAKRARVPVFTSLPGNAEKARCSIWEPTTSASAASRGNLLRTSSRVAIPRRSRSRT
ncbi:MAG: hypothetical protein ACRD3G_21530 [Vicinamibacterales bacterium]